MQPHQFLTLIAADGHALIRLRDERTGTVKSQVLQPSRYNPDDLNRKFHEMSQTHSVWACVAEVDHLGRVKQSRLVWADLDWKNYPGGETQARGLIEQSGFVPSFTVHSGHGLHVYAILDEPAVPQEAALMAKHLQWRLGADAAQQVNKLMRIPGTVNPKHLSEKARLEGYTTPVPCRLESETGLVYRLDDLPRDDTLVKVPHGTLKSLLHGPKSPDVDRSGFDFGLAKDLMRDGLRQSEVEHLLMTYPGSGKVRSEGGNARHYVQQTLKRVFSPTFAAPTSERPPVNWQIKTLAELKEEARAQFVVEDFLPVGGVAMIAAPPKARKSWTAMELAHAVASGSSWLDFECHSARKVLYVQAELPDWLVYERFEQLFGTDVALMQNLATITVPAADFLAGDVDGLVQQASAFGAELVIIDPIANFWQGEENNSGQVNALFDALAAFKTVGCALVLVHHARKTQQGEFITAQHMRGSNVWFARPDAVLTLTPREYDTVAHRVLRAAKPRENLRLTVTDSGGFRVAGTGDAPLSEQQRIPRVTSPEIEAWLAPRREAARQKLIARGLLPAPQQPPAQA